MRLSQEEQSNIKNLAKKIFGETSKVILFGSRVFDNKKGGDIDLLIENDERNKLTLINKIHFLIELKNKIGEQKIDIVLNYGSKKSIIKTANNTGIQLY